MHKDMHKAVFLDRDGVINRAFVREGKPYPPAGLAEVEILPGVAEALASLHDAGFMLIVITNQPDVARGTTAKAVVESINQYLAERLPIDEFRTCYHDDQDGCDCRKPLPGMALAASRDLKLELSGSFMVGDKRADLELADAIGATGVLVSSGHGQSAVEWARSHARPVFGDFKGAAEYIAAQGSEG